MSRFIVSVGRVGVQGEETGAEKTERHLAYQWQGTQHQVILVCFFYGLNSWELCLQLSLSISTWDNLLVKALGF